MRGGRAACAGSAIAVRPAHPAGRRSSRRRRRTAGASRRPGKKRDLAVERAGAAQPSGPDVPPAPSTMRAALDRNRRRKRAAQLEQDERDLPLAAPTPLGLLVNGERGRAHLVRRAHVDAVHLPVRRHRREVHDAGREHDRRGGAREHPHQRPEAADAARRSPSAVRFASRRSLSVRSRAAGEWQTVAGRPGDEIERRGAMRSVEQSDERGGIGERVAALAAIDRGTGRPLSSPHRSIAHRAQGRSR